MKILIHIIFGLSFAVTALTISGSANAFEHLGRHSDNASLALADSNLMPLAMSPVIFTPLGLQLSQGSKVRSRSDVMREVKQRYNAEVLRIKLNEKRMVYQVRVLMPNGKVKNITVSAQR